MTPLLAQFLSEARDFLQGIGDKVMLLENDPDNSEVMTALFRLVHTLKGNSGLFEFQEMTRVLHAAEDLMDAVRHGRVPYSNDLADRLLDAMDFVGALCDEVEEYDRIDSRHAADSARIAQSLHELLAGVQSHAGDSAGPSQSVVRSETVAPNGDLSFLLAVPEGVRMAAYRRASEGGAVHWIDYRPAEECYFRGDDPFFQARGTPDLLWGSIRAREPWPPLAALDAYRCVLSFELLSTAPREALDEYYRYVPDQLCMLSVPPSALVLPVGHAEGAPPSDELVGNALALLAAGDIDGLGRIARARLAVLAEGQRQASALRWFLLLLELQPEDHAALRALIEAERRTPEPLLLPVPAVLTADEAAGLAVILAVQRDILGLPVEEGWHLGRLKAVAATLRGCLEASGDAGARAGLDAATASALAARTPTALLAWLDSQVWRALPASEVDVTAPVQLPAGVASEATVRAEVDAARPEPLRSSEDGDGEPKFGRRAGDHVGGAKSLKVDQTKIDRLVNLIGEMVVSKNALPYLAGRAETVFGVRELSREIKAQYTIINRIAEEMQDAIMQVSMMPVSFVFQRFPRLVRDISRKLGKEVNLVLEGEETEADKNIIESLGDPLVHIVRNSLDHGIEQPEVRRAAGKPAAGRLTIRASQVSDRVVIEISDDGKGIDPTVIKRKAYEKGLIEESALERLSDQEAVNLIFASGFSTMDVVSDLSGRGVGMDVVRTAVEKVNGTVAVESERGHGTRIRLSLPLSMAVTNVMVIESDGQLFGMPMDSVVETVRVPRQAVCSIKKSQTAVLRGRIVPLKSINFLLGLSAAPRVNAEDELAVLVVRLGDEWVGLLVDEFREAIDIILKPMTGVLSGLSAYSGSALMGDGSVLMVLNAKELM